MDWALAIDRNREALLRVVARLFAMAGLDEAETVTHLPRHLRAALIRLARPTEAAVRRLIVVLAELEPAPLPGPARAAKAQARGKPKRNPGSAPTPPAFAIIDPLPNFNSAPPRFRPLSYPRITVLGVSEPRPIPDGWIPRTGDPVNATGLCRRLRALKRALDDLPAHGRRLARWHARRLAGRRRGRFSPMRPGHPPGHRKRPTRTIDEILRECHALALHARATFDTS